MAKTLKYNKRRQKRSRSISRKGGSGVIASLRTALLPFLFYKVHKKLQKRKGRKTLKRRKTRRRRR